MEELKKEFPEGVDYRIIYDTTVFVQESINADPHPGRARDAVSQGRRRRGQQEIDLSAIEKSVRDRAPWANAVLNKENRFTEDLVWYRHLNGFMHIPRRIRFSTWMIIAEADR